MRDKTVYGELLGQLLEDLADALAPRLAEAAYAAPPPPEPWLSADDLATLLAVSPDWVRRHEVVLGGRRLPGGRPRFRLSRAEEAMSARDERKSAARPGAYVERRAERQAQRRVALLDVRGPR